MVDSLKSSAANEMHVFDRTLLKQRRRRIIQRFQDYDFLFQWAERQCIERLFDVKRRFPNALQIGARQSAGFRQALLETGKIDHLQCMDFCEHPQVDIIADEEFLPIAPQSQDLIFSTLHLHSTNDLPGALLQIRQALKPDGLFVASLFGGETLFELRESLMHAEMAVKGGVSPRVFPFADKQQAGALLQRAGFALPVIDSDIVTVTYEHIFKLMHDVRGMGESNIIEARNRRNPGKELFMRAGEYYAQNYAESDGRIAARFEVIFMLGWAPHESQQKPLEPGSAQKRLSDALNATERIL